MFVPIALRNYMCMSCPMVAALQLKLAQITVSDDRALLLACVYIFVMFRNPFGRSCKGLMSFYMCVRICACC